jgi:hypothetical protein
MKAEYFKFYTFKDMSIYEMSLMSMILSYHKSGKVICFSNEYAALRLGLSKKTITRTMNTLKDKGFIEPQYTPLKRFVKVLKEPEPYSFNDDVCDLETSGLTDHTYGLIDHTYGLTDPTYGLRDQGVWTNSPTYIKDNIKDNIKDVVAAVEETTTPSLLDFLIKEFNEVYRKQECILVWNTLTQQEQTQAVEMVGAIKEYQREKGKDYDLYYYLSKRVFTWKTLTNIQRRLTKQKNVKKDLSPEEKARIFEQQNPDFFNNLKT